MDEITVRRIMAYSAAGFGLLGLKFVLADAASIIIGLTAELMDTKKQKEKATSVSLEINSVLNRAYKQTEMLVHDSDERAILMEISQKEKIVDIQSLIESTERYKQIYCKDAQLEKLVNLFDRCLREEIIQNQTVNNLFVMNTQLLTIDNLKKIQIQTKELNSISTSILGVTVNTQKDVIETRDNVNKIRHTISSLVSNCIAIIFEIFIFMILFFTFQMLETKIKPLTLSQFWQVVLSFIFSEFLFGLTKFPANLIRFKAHISTLFTAVCFFICNTVMDSQANAYFDPTISDSNRYIMLVCIIIGGLFVKSMKHIIIKKAIDDSNTPGTSQSAIPSQKKKLNNKRHPSPKEK